MNGPDNNQKGPYAGGYDEWYFIHVMRVTDKDLVLDLEVTLGHVVFHPRHEGHGQPPYPIPHLTSFRSVVFHPRHEWNRQAVASTKELRSGMWYFIHGMSGADRSARPGGP